MFYNKIRRKLSRRKFKIAFTMAEVLITLGIIGVVAALTFPQLLKHYRKVEVETRLKKAYTIISQAYLAAQAKHGEGKDWVEWEDSLAIVERYLAPEIKNVKIYQPNGEELEGEGNLGSVTAMCFENKYVGNHVVTSLDIDAQYVWMDNICISNPFYGSTTSMMLPDGTCIGINGTSVALANQSKNIIVDVNGSLQGPNMAGYDLFFFLFKDNNIVPYGYDLDLEELKSANRTNACNKKATHGGYTCAARIMAESWTIKYW